MKLTEEKKRIDKITGTLNLTKFDSQRTLSPEKNSRTYAK